MKDAVTCQAIPEEFADRNDPIWADILRLLKVINRKSHETENALLDALQFIQDVRYRTWPSSGKPFGLEPEAMDELIQKIDKAMNASIRSSSKPK